MTRQLLKALGLPTPPSIRRRLGLDGDGPENLADLYEDAEVDEALRLAARQQRLDALAANPRGATPEDTLLLDEQRRSAQAALSARDAGMADREIAELQALQRDIAHTVEVRRVARRTAFAQRLAALDDPAGIAMLPQNPLAGLRSRLQEALDAGDLPTVEDGLVALAQARADAVEAIEVASQERAAALRAELGALQPPDGAEDAELAVLLPLRDAVAAAIDAPRFGEAAAKLIELREAMARAADAIAARRRQRLAAVQKLVDSFTPPKEADTAELARIGEALNLVVTAIGSGDPTVAETQWIGLLRALRAVQRAIQKRQERAHKDDAARKAQEQRDADQSLLEAERANVEKLRRWIETHIYTPNGEIKAAGGVVLATNEADDCWELDRLSSAGYDAALLRLAPEQAALAQLHALARRVLAARALAPARLADLAKKIERCDSLKLDMAKSTTASIKRLGGKADLVKDVTAEVKRTLDGIDKLKAELATRRHTLTVLNLATISCQPAEVAALAAAELVLAQADPAPCFAQVLALNRSLTSECSAVELLDLGKAWVGRGLWYKTIQPILNLACGQRLPAGIFEARLRLAYAAQNLIRVESVGSILGMGDGGKLWVCGASSGYRGVACHLSLYKTIYSGGCSWSDPVDTILAALIGGTGDNGLHITWEWTGKRDEEHNLKCFRSGKASATGRTNYIKFVEGRLAAAIKAGDYTPADLGGPYPYCADAIADLYQMLKAEIAELRKRIVERCANRGLSQAEADGNTADKLELPKT